MKVILKDKQGKVIQFETLHNVIEYNDFELGINENGGARVFECEEWLMMNGEGSWFK